MSTSHRGGNIQNEITLEEHDGTNNAKRVNVVSGTITASSQVTVTPQIAWPDPKTYIGLVTATMSGSVNTGMTTIFPGPNFIGLTTSVIGSAPTLYAVVNTSAAGQSSVVLDTGANWIGIATVWTANAQANTGNVTLNPSPNFVGIVTVTNKDRTITGNLTLSDSKAYIGLTSVSGAVGINTGTNYIGLVTAVPSTTARSITGNLTLSDPKGYIGLVSVAQPLSTTFAGNVTLDAGSKTQIAGNVTLSDSKGFIGLTTAVIGSAPTLYAVVNTSAAGQSSVVLDTGTKWVGLVTAYVANSVGNATLNPSPNFIGLTTSVIGSAPTLYAVVNTSAAGQSSVVLDTGANWVGLVTAQIVGSVNTGMLTIFPGPNQIGSVTVSNPVSIAGNLTLSDPKGFIGLVSVVPWADPKTYIGLVTATLAGSVNTGMTTLFPGPNQIGSVTVSHPVSVAGNLTLSDSKTYIGLVSVSHAAWADPKTYIGLITVGHTVTSSVVGNLTLSDSKAYIGLVSISGSAGIVGNVTLSDSKAGIGLVSVFGGSIGVVGNVTLSDAKTYVGLTTSTLGVGTQFIGLVTAWSRNAGTSKVLISTPIGLGQNSIATIAVPTNANKVNVTNMLISSNITTEVAILSGVTYLTGNASLGVTLFPGGGFELPGSPDSPSWIGLPSGALVVEKRDPGGTTSKIGGGLIYFDE